MGWFQTTYSVRFNRRHRRSGHLYQGRFKEYGYRDGSGIHRVVHRLEEVAKVDRDLAHRLQQLADRVSSVKS